MMQNTFRERSDMIVDRCQNKLGSGTEFMETLTKKYYAPNLWKPIKNVNHLKLTTPNNSVYGWKLSSRKN